MNSAEDVMWTRPDGASATLETIDTLRLRTESQRARFSLLYIMALNRNWIDTTDLHLILPAVSYYYKNHGSNDDNDEDVLLSWYGSAQCRKSGRCDRKLCSCLGILVRI